jgi:hypothetical protein
MSTPAWRAVFDAYLKVTGIPVTPSTARIDTCNQILKRGITAEEVEAVLKRLQQLIRSGKFGYTDSSLDWRNAMLKVDQMEERVLKLRQEAARRPKPRPMVPVSRPLPDGRTETVQAPAPDREPVSIDPAKTFEAMAAELRKKHGR